MVDDRVRTDRCGCAIGNDDDDSSVGVGSQKNDSVNPSGDELSELSELWSIDYLNDLASVFHFC